MNKHTILYLIHFKWGPVIWFAPGPEQTLTGPVSAALIDFSISKTNKNNNKNKQVTLGQQEDTNIEGFCTFLFIQHKPERPVHAQPLRGGRAAPTNKNIK